MKNPRNTLVEPMFKRHSRLQIFSDRRTKRSKQKLLNDLEEELLLLEELDFEEDEDEED